MSGRGCPKSMTPAFTSPGGGLSRRDFLSRSAAVAAGLALGAVPRRARGEIEFPRGTFPTHRVVRTFDPGATGWDWSSNYYFEAVDQERVSRMVDEAVRFLAGVEGKNAPVRAWKRILASYGAGDRVAIKINCNNSSNLSNDIDASPPVLLPVIRALVEYCKVPEGNIFVYDVARAIPRERLRNRIPYAVVYVPSGHELAAQDPGAQVLYRGIGPQFMPRVVTEAQHLINLPLFKNHSICLSTMAFKNHLGTTRPGPSNLHSPIDSNLADLNSCEHIRTKTRLLIADALWGIWTGGPGGVPQKWSTFGGGTPNCIFAATDPVAHESVMADYLIAERTAQGREIRSHAYLHDAMELHGLGIHEHRDAASGRYRLIDSLQVDTSRPGSSRVTVR
jgi:uncharacterized protein (DUF362 family)